LTFLDGYFFLNPDPETPPDMKNPIQIFQTESQIEFVSSSIRVNAINKPTLKNGGTMDII